MSQVIVGIQGGIGSTNERACRYFAKKYNWNDYEIQYLISSKNVLDALEKGKINYGTFAWKSSRSGLVLETQEAIKKYTYKKIDEVSFQLNHALLQNSEIDKNHLVRIYSHIQALQEHKSFLEKEFLQFELVEEQDTALAAKRLRDNEYPSNSLVIAPLDCAEIYNLDVYLADLPSNEGYITTLYLVKQF